VISKSKHLTVINVGQNYRITGGSDRYFFDLAELLESKGNTVVPFAAQHPENMSSEWDAYFPPGADFNSVSPINVARFFYSPLAAKQLRKLLSCTAPNIAHLHIYYGKLTASILQVLKDRSIPIVQTLHEYKLVCPVYTLNSNGTNCQRCSVGHYLSAVRQRCNRKSFARSLLSAAESYISTSVGAVEIPDQFIAVSEFARERAIEGGIPGKKISVLHNFTFPDRLKPTTSEGSYFVFYGRIERLKGIFTLVRAAEMANIDLVIVGRGNASAELAEYVSDRRLQNHVKILPFLGGEALAEVVRGGICTVVPSEWYETFGLTIIESFCYGRPVVASRTGGMTEIVDEGIDGLLFTPGDETELAEKLRFMDANRGIAAEMGKRGRVKAETQFSPQRHFDGLSKIYNDVMR
jgi:glycosyltransferase involved in cell wall biosynthesis